MVIFELLKGLAEGNLLFIFCCLLLLILNGLLNFAFSVTFGLQIDDYQFNEYRAKNVKTYRAIRGLYTVASMHLFRLSFCKLFSVPGFHASATVPNAFMGPLRLYTRLYILAVLVPAVLLNSLASLKTEDLWTNQLQMTMVEVCILGALLAGLLLWEYYCQSPRQILHRPSDENPFFIGLFKDESLNKVEAGAVKQKQVEDATYWQVADKSLRHEKLQEVLRTVKCHVDLMLNN